MSSMISCGCLPSMLQPTDWAVPRISLIVPAAGDAACQCFTTGKHFEKHRELHSSRPGSLSPLWFAGRSHGVSPGDSKPLWPLLADLCPGNAPGSAKPVALYLSPRCTTFTCSCGAWGARKPAELPHHTAATGRSQQPGQNTAQARGAS